MALPTDTDTARCPGTSPWPQVLQGPVFSLMDSPLGRSPSGWRSVFGPGLSSAAAQGKQPCPGPLPAQAHGHSCYQNVPRHS